MPSVEALAKSGDEEAQKIIDAFETFDEDGSGTLSSAEFLKILTRGGTGSTLTVEDAKEVAHPLPGCQ